MLIKLLNGKEVDVVNSFRVTKLLMSNPKVIEVQNRLGNKGELNIENLQVDELVDYMSVAEIVCWAVLNGSGYEVSQEEVEYLIDYETMLQITKMIEDQNKRAENLAKKKELLK